jgi:hypothetical protein
MNWITLTEGYLIIAVVVDQISLRCPSRSEEEKLGPGLRKIAATLGVAVGTLRSFVALTVQGLPRTPSDRRPCQRSARGTPACRARVSAPR